MSTFARGEIVAGKYRIIQLIGSGGMGHVYEVEHLQTGAHRALKVLFPHLLQSPSHDRFQREGTVAARVGSDLIVDVLDSGVDEATGIPFILMELLRGEDLNKRLRRLGPMPPEEVVLHLRWAARALDKTHAAGIIHRDLKPGNLFLAERDDGEPRIKVLDFGIAKILAEDGVRTSATRGVGTPIYMAPEQFKSRHKVTPESDVYSLGMVAFTLLVGWPYWHDESTSDENVFAFADAARAGPAEPASERALRRGIELDPAFDVWFARCCAADPDSRFPSASRAIAALGQAFGIAPNESLPPPRPSGKALSQPPSAPEEVIPPTAPFAFQSHGGAESQPQVQMQTQSDSVDPGSRTFGDVVVSNQPSNYGRAALLPALLVVVAVGAVATFFVLRRGATAQTAQTAAAAQSAPTPLKSLPLRATSTAVSSAATASAPAPSAPSSTAAAGTTPEPGWTVVDPPSAAPTSPPPTKSQSGAGGVPPRSTKPGRSDSMYSRD